MEVLYKMDCAAAKIGEYQHHGKAPTRALSMTLGGSRDSCWNCCGLWDGGLSGTATAVILALLLPCSLEAATLKQAAQQYQKGEFALALQEYEELLGTIR